MSRFFYCYAGCRHAECHYAECRYAECHHAECHKAECHYAECRGALDEPTSVTNNSKKFYKIGVWISLFFAQELNLSLGLRRIC